MNYSFRSTYSLCLCIVLFCLHPTQVRSQNWNTLFKYLNEKDKSIIDEALKSVTLAGNKTNEANTYYNEALQLQSNNEIDERSLQKQLSKIESKAVAKQIEADKLYSGAYKSVYEICIKHLMTFDPETFGDYKVKADEMMNQAAERRKEAKEMRNPYEKATLLNNAAGLEDAAVENMIIAVCIAHGDNTSKSLLAGGQNEDAEVQNKILLSVENALKSQDSDIEKLALNQNAIRKYDNYVANESVPDPQVINRTGVSGMDGFDIDQARTIYQGNRTDNTAPVLQNNYIEESSQNVTAAGTVPESSPNNIKNATNQSGISKSAYAATSNAVNSSGVTNANPVQQDLEVRFMVQIAASRIPLTRAQVWAIYPGNLTVEVMKDKDWYKYRIMGFRFFGAAGRVAGESGANNAWVLSTYLGKDITLAKAQEMTRLLEVNSKQYEHSSIVNELDFYVQVAASKVRFSDESLSDICNYATSCREVIEEGWFKYQLFAGTNYKEAVILMKSISTNSFVVAYKEGTKINLYQAIHNRK